MTEYDSEYRHLSLMPSYILLSDHVNDGPVKLDVGIGKLLALSYKYENPKGFQYRSP